VEESGPYPKRVFMGWCAGRKINWVKWSVVCKDRKNGGLGVRDIRLVNLSLLAKWRWRLLTPGRALWKDILVAKYENHIVSNVDWSNFTTPTLASIWWKNIVALNNSEFMSNWFVDAVKCNVGNGLSTLFWTTKWVGEAPLAVVFPRLFSLSTHRDCKVGDIVDSVGGNRRWSLVWR
jgi:hypothetical protein